MLLKKSFIYIKNHTILDPDLVEKLKMLAIKKKRDSMKY